MKLIQITRLLNCLIVTILVWLIPLTALSDENLTTQFRRPVAVAVSTDGSNLVIANQRSGSISLVDPTEKKVVLERVIGKRLSSICVTANPSQYLVTDEEAHELIVITVSPTAWHVEKRLAVRPYPVNVKISEDGAKAFVASLWSKSITIIDLKTWLTAGNKEPTTSTQQVQLPFSPRELLVIETTDQQQRIPGLEHPRSKLIVADAFGSRIAVVDIEKAQLDSVREIPAHAIRGLHLHPTKPLLMMSHQTLNRNAQTSFDDVHWGTLMVNVLRSVDLAGLLDPKADLVNQSLLEYLGGPDRGAADPGQFVMRADGVTGIVLSGTDELIIHDENHVFSGRVKTEHYPTAIAIRPDGKHAYVLNTLSDSVSIVQLSGPIVVGTISLGPQPEPAPTDRGEMLFHNGKLSHDGWISCASCHVDGHTNGLLNDNKTDGSFGTAKRVLTLRGIGDTQPYSWSGRFNTLSEQIGHSIRSTMQGEALSDQQIGDLEAYLRTFSPPPPVGTDDKSAVARGAAIFESQNCRSCHTSPQFTSRKIVDVGLKDERGNSQFNPPSLRGVSQNAPYFHDGRASNLDAVFTEFGHQLDHKLSSDELSDLIAFLNDL